MAEQSKIEWCDHTFNPWEGCQKVGPGCDHCYAETRNARYGGGIAVNWGPGAPRRRTSVSNWKKPLQWNAAHAAFFAEHGRRQRVFCASLADVFDNAVDPAWRMDLFSLIAQTPNLDWLLLTKRIGNVQKMSSGDGLMFDMIARRVWLGISVVNQEEADRDIPKLLAVPAAKRFLSMEPLLGPVDLLKNSDPLCRCDGCMSMARKHPEHPGLQRIDWVIVGGESGAGARPMHPDWARSLRDQCTAAGVPFLFKQWGEWWPNFGADDDMAPVYDFADGDSGTSDHGAPPPGVPCCASANDPKAYHWEGYRYDEPGSGDGSNNFTSYKVGKKAAGRLLDGIQHDGYPLTRTARSECD
jgi:protein gp37